MVCASRLSPAPKATWSDARTALGSTSCPNVRSLGRAAFPAQRRRASKQHSRARVGRQGLRRHSQTERHPDAETAIPYLEHALPLRRRHDAPARYDVIDPRADKAPQHTPHGDAKDEIWISAHSLPSPERQCYAAHDSEQQHDSVHVNRCGAEVESAARRRWKEAQRWMCGNRHRSVLARQRPSRRVTGRQSVWTPSRDSATQT